MLRDAPAPQSEPHSRARQCAGLLSRLAFHYAGQHGLDVHALLRGAGLSADAIHDKSAQIAVPQQIKFVALVAEALGDDLLGVRLVQDFDFRELGWIYYTVASATTLADALARLERYNGLHNEGVRVSVQTRPQLSIQFRYSGVRRYSDTQQISSFLAMLLFLARHITATRLTDAEVRIAHRVAHKRELEGLLGCPVRDLSRCDEIRFSAKAAAAPVQRADPYLHELCERACAAAVAQKRVSKTDVRNQVENFIAEMLPHGQARQRDVAARLGMTVRTLTRRLAREDCTFSTLLREVRLGLAQQYLNDGLSVSEVAWLVGYADVSTFSHAFQRWNGTAPSAMRRAAMSNGKTGAAPGNGRVRPHAAM